MTYSRFKKVLWIMLVIWTLIVGIKVGIFIYDTSVELNDYISYIEGIEGDIMGESSLASLIALKTNKTIHNLQIDTNFQRRIPYNFTNSLLISEENKFNLEGFNCSLISSRDISNSTYRLWRC